MKKDQIRNMEDEDEEEICIVGVNSLDAKPQRASHQIHSPMGHTLCSNTHNKVFAITLKL